MTDSEITIATEVLDRLSAAEAREYHLIPADYAAQLLSCYAEAGRDYQKVTEEIETLTGDRLELRYLPAGEFARLMGRCYRESGQVKAAVTDDSLGTGGEPGIVQRLLEEAYADRASDIHFEAYESRCRIRFRIDGQLIERHVIEKGRYAALVNRMKILANLDISEKRLPQDGRILYNRNGHTFDVRVSSLPAIHGEKMVLRLLTRPAELLDVRNLGFDAGQLEGYLAAVRKPHGLVLISGPTGSGKSTTLYATLRLLNETCRNILTIEDPVEYTLEGVNQVQLKEEIGLTFTGALRTFLRQDPDIIMLGEIRDADTAQMAIRSSLTGHLIFSTIHTNSAWSCVSRLTDMGVHPYLIADTLNLCVAQRLVRLLCPQCKQTAVKDKRLYHAVGCEACYYTGYSGRKAIYEVLPSDATLARLIREGKNEVSDYLREKHIRTLEDSALQLAFGGLTSAEEIFPLLSEENQKRMI